jgi:hypothetical protein
MHVAWQSPDRVSDYARDRCMRVKERTENYPMNMNVVMKQEKTDVYM